MTGKKPDPLLSDHLVGYVDVLGFRAAVQTKDPKAHEAIFLVLDEFARSSGGYKFSQKHKQDGMRETSIHPAISTFSDHLVIAYRIDDLHKTYAGVFHALMAIRDICSAAAHRAREIDCLIRGAVTIGPLFQSERVIFGPGLVRAYELESNAAVYPRIIIDHDVMGKFNNDLIPLHTMFIDQDGFWCLDYMTAYLGSFGSENDEATCTARRTWALGMRSKWRESAQTLVKIGNYRAAQKWFWFVSRFEDSMLGLNQSLFGAGEKPLQFP
jgi:hypothetical protein